MCPDTAVLSAYFDSELSHANSMKLESHLSECPVCRAALDIFRDQRIQFQSLDSELPADTITLRNFWSFSGHARLRKFTRPKRITIPIPLAAAAALILLLSMILNFFSFDLQNQFPQLLLVEQYPPTRTVVSLTITPGELEDFFDLIEGKEGFNGETVHVIPAELPVARFGDPQFVHPVSLEGAP